eukprot:7824876-Pyramimonas_sp.AAC.1
MYLHRSVFARRLCSVLIGDSTSAPPFQVLEEDALIDLEDDATSGGVDASGGVHPSSIGGANQTSSVTPTAPGAELTAPTLAPQPTCTLAAAPIEVQSAGDAEPTAPTLAPQPTCTLATAPIAVQSAGDAEPTAPTLAPQPTCTLATAPIE